MASQATAAEPAAARPAPEAPAVAEAEPQAIVVTGLRASLDNARGIKRASSGIVDAISTKDIGKLPDANLAESLQRITGVSIDRSGGEGAFITVRGFGPEFNTVLVNGRQVATPTDPSQASGRAFSFDTLASELVSGVEVYKSSTARYQSGGVGSTVNIKTARPFDYRGRKFSATVDANYDGNAKKAAPDASFLFSDTLADGKLGILVSGSYQHRFTRLQQAQTDGWLVNPAVPAGEVNGGKGTVSASNPQGNLFIPQNFDTKVTREDRERIGGTVVLQYRPSDAVTITADALYQVHQQDRDAVLRPLVHRLEPDRRGHRCQRHRHRSDPGQRHRHRLPLQEVRQAHQHARVRAEPGMEDVAQPHRLIRRHVFAGEGRPQRRPGSLSCAAGLSHRLVALSVGWIGAAVADRNPAHLCQPGQPLRQRGDQFRPARQHHAGRRGPADVPARDAAARLWHS
jgi:TonB-dependent receptor